MHTFRNIENLEASKDKSKVSAESKNFQPYQIMEENDFKNKITEDIPHSESQESEENINFQPYQNLEQDHFENELPEPRNELINLRTFKRTFIKVKDLPKRNPSASLNSKKKIKNFDKKHNKRRERDVQNEEVCYNEIRGFIRAQGQF